MRYADGTLIGDLGDDFIAQTSSSVVPANSLTGFDENQTEYDLFPSIINKPPSVAGNIVDTSTPKIRPLSVVDSSGEEMYINEDGIVRVCINSSFTLRFVGVQTNTLNVENGVPSVIESTQALTYQWKLNDTAITNFKLPTFQSSLSINDNSLTIERIQIRHGGTYSCEVSNDIGVTTSETITIEVYDPNSDNQLFTNLVQNPNAIDGTDGWFSNTSEFTTKTLSTYPIELLKTPHRVDVFGYVPDNFHPRPYQIETGVLRGVRYSSDLTTNKGAYFSRSSYKYERYGESTHVKAYQDIDLSDLTQVISGGVYGIRGLKGVFSCYIGNAIAAFNVVKELVAANSRLNRRKYYSGAPRVSLENFLQAGPGDLVDRIYVTLEEYRNETRLVSRVLNPDGSTSVQNKVITLQDPWNKRLNDYYNQQYYAEPDQYQLGELSKREKFDMVLFTADELEPNYSNRYTHGQYAELNKVILNNLNPRTNKIRITINIVSDDPRLSDLFLPVVESSQNVYDFVSWQRPWRKATFSTEDYSIYEYINQPQYLNQSSIEPSRKYLLLSDPRPLATGFVFALIPDLAFEQETTNYYLLNSLTQNNTPAAATPDTLIDFPFDPLERNKRILTVRFSHRSTFGISSDGTGGPEDTSVIQQFSPSNSTFIGFTEATTTGPDTVTPVSTSSLFPFSSGSLVDFSTNTSTTSSIEVDRVRVASTFVGDGIEYSTDAIEDSYITNLHLLQRQLDSTKYWGAVPPRPSAMAIQDAYTGGVVDEDGDYSSPAQWQNSVRFQLYYLVRQNNKNLSNPATFGNPAWGDGSINHNCYYVDINLNQSSGSVFFSRDNSLPGFGQLDPVTASFGFIDESLYFTLPTDVLFNSLESGGLAHPTITLPGLQEVLVSRQNAQPIFKLISSASFWYELGEVYGNDVRDQLISNVFPGPAEDGLALQPTTLRQSAITNARTSLTQLLNLARLPQLSALQQQSFSTLVTRSVDYYNDLYGASGSLIQVRINQLAGVFTPTNQVIQTKLYSEAAPFPFIVETRSLASASYYGVGADNLPGQYSINSITGSTVVTTDESLLAKPVPASDQVALTFLSYQLLGTSSSEQLVTVKHPDYATSLYLAQAAPGGTPLFGINPDGVRYYLVKYGVIQDQQINDSQIL